MRVFFRTDASLQIGIGHVMRCLTLADTLSARGVNCKFICRDHPGNIIEQIRQRGFQVEVLLSEQLVAQSTLNQKHIDYAAWLGVSWQLDAEQTKNKLGKEKIDWLIVDHYAIDARWESTLKPNCHWLMTIDDLANRPHDCDVLLDQNLGRNAEDYLSYLPKSCKLLLGPQYALLRPQFAEVRSYSLQRRIRPQLKSLLITMGGTDYFNSTGAILKALGVVEFSAHLHITVAMGPNAPWIDNVRQLAKSLPLDIEVLVNVEGMAQLMASSDLVIAAAGSTSWELCCLGIPTVLVQLADNQREVAAALASAGAVKLVTAFDNIQIDVPKALIEMFDPEVLVRFGQTAQTITDGLGVIRVTECLSHFNQGDITTR